uniref:Protein kinase domain-containing protein n=1 Tax=Acrobeloides nanus TaxID=290746 RepID=A0A914DUL3_9BILA
MGTYKQQSRRNKVENFYPDGFCGVEGDKLQAELYNANAEEFEIMAHLRIIHFMFLESQFQLNSDLFGFINLITVNLAAKTPLSQFQPKIDAWRKCLQEYYDPIVDRFIKLDEINNNFKEYSKNIENQICSPPISDFINSEKKLIQEYMELLEKWIDEQKAREKESPSEPNHQSRTYLEELLVKYDYFSSLANHFSSLLKIIELTVFYYSTKEVPKETCDFIKKYLTYEAKGADGTVFKFGGLIHVGFAIKTLSNPETISFYQDKGVKLRHDNIVRYIRCFPLNTTGPTTSYALLMQKSTNTLSDYIYSDKYISRYMYIYWMTQIVCGMEYLHENRIIHRDLKPENILLVSNDEIKICDLDRACDFDDVDRLKSSSGTIRYMAPETFARGNKNLSLRPLPEMVPNMLKNLIKECLDRDLDRRPSFIEIVDTIPKIREAIIHIDEKSWHNISQQDIQINNIDHFAATEAAYLVLKDHTK